MPQSLCKNIMHIVFSTKHRQDLITEEIKNDLYNEIISVSRTMECEVVEIGGTANHIHIIVRVSRKIALMTYVQKVKNLSSGWVKHNYGEEYVQFFWQKGYGAFSVNAADMNRVLEYVRNQEKHHADFDFKTEYRKILKKYDVEYDERFVWD